MSRARLRRIAARLYHRSRQLQACRRGSIAVTFALCTPPVCLGAVAAVQLYDVYSVKSQTQDVADSSALWGAQQLPLTPSGAGARTQQWAQAQLVGVTGGASITNIAATQLDAQTMSVEIDSTVPSFFGNMLPVGGFKLKATATAVGASLTPLCVLVTAPSSGDSLALAGTSQMQSTCLVQSDSTLSVASGATLTAGAIATSSSATGTMTPAANTGAPVKADPFTSLNTAAPSSCSVITAAVNLLAAATLSPGTYCYPIYVMAGALTLSGGNYVFGGGVYVSGSGSLALNAGNFYFSSPLTVSGNGSVTGTDCVLDFVQPSSGSTPTVSLSGSATISIKGRQSGALAGFVLIVDKSITSSFQIQSDYISTLTGTVYAPAALLQVQGTKKAIQASDWTVIDARSLQMTGSPDLVINSNYSTSAVPTPLGVGPSGGRTKLTQ
ncbi:MAG: TadE/TadG family type IV pilus assembly protein [Caulobacteraceae bacterium]